MDVRRDIADHVDLLVAGLEACVRFSDVALPPLGITQTDCSAEEGFVGVGVDGVVDVGSTRPGPDNSPAAHIAFARSS